MKITASTDGQVITITIGTTVKSLDIADLYCSVDLADAVLPDNTNYSKKSYLENPFVCVNEECDEEDEEEVVAAKIVDDRLELTVTCAECGTTVIDIFNLKNIEKRVSFL